MINHSNTFIGDEEINATLALLEQGKLISGTHYQSLTSELKEVLDSKYLRVTSSGTMAFFLILKALGVCRYDDVLLPDYICSDLLGPLVMLGANPITYDNAVGSYLASSEEILSRVTDKTKVVLVNHTFGFANMCINELRSKLPQQIHIVEDCCHFFVPRSNPMSFHTRHGSICCFYSFNATKLLASGEGGAISSNDEGFYERLSQIKIGDKLSDINCAIARVQLSRIDFFLSRRKEIASKYTYAFKDFLCADYKQVGSIYFRFPITTNTISRFWASNRVVYRKGVDSLLSAKLNIIPKINAKKTLDSTVSLPIYPSLSDADVQIIINDAINLLKV